MVSVEVDETPRVGWAAGTVDNVTQTADVRDEQLERVRQPAWASSLWLTRWTTVGYHTLSHSWRCAALGSWRSWRVVPKSMTARVSVA